MTTVKETIEHLRRSYKENQHIAVAIWCIEDVMERAKERGIKITEEQAEELIDRVDRKQDASIGISWDTIDCYLDDLE